MIGSKVIKTAVWRRRGIVLFLRPVGWEAALLGPVPDGMHGSHAPADHRSDPVAQLNRAAAF